MSKRIEQLSRLAVGQQGRVARLEAEEGIQRRLLEMGFVRGEVVQVEKLAPLGDPMELVIKGYNVWSAGTYSLAPFVRFESFNTASSFEALEPASLTPSPAVTEKVWTAGFNFNLNAHIVLKADLCRFKEDTGRNHVDFGLGWAF